MPKDALNDVTLVPARPIEVTLRAAVPVFLRVTAWEAEVSPTVVAAKVRVVGE